MKDTRLVASLQLRSSVSRLNDTYEELVDCINKLVTVNLCNFEVSTNIINNTILPMIDLAISRNMPDNIQKLDKTKNVIYVLNSKGAVMNNRAQNMGWRYYKHIKMSFKRIHQALNIQGSKKVTLTRTSD